MKFIRDYSSQLLTVLGLSLIHICGAIHVVDDVTYDVIELFEDNSAKEIIEKLVDRYPQTEIAVSYTHLDVYKRQVLWEALKSWDWMCACIFTTPTEPGVKIQSLTKASMR